MRPRHDDKMDALAAGYSGGIANFQSMLKATLGPSYHVLKALADKGNWRAKWRLRWHYRNERDALLEKALNTKYRTPFLDEIKNEYFVLRLKGEIWNSK